MLFLEIYSYRNALTGSSFAALIPRLILIPILAPQHHIGGKHAVPIMESAVTAVLLCGMPHGL